MKQWHWGEKRGDRAKGKPQAEAGSEEQLTVGAGQSKAEARTVESEDGWRATAAAAGERVQQWQRAERMHGGSGGRTKEPDDEGAAGEGCVIESRRPLIVLSSIVLVVLWL